MEDHLRRAIFCRAAHAALRLGNPADMVLHPPRKMRASASPTTQGEAIRQLSASHPGSLTKLS